MMKMKEKQVEKIDAEAEEDAEETAALAEDAELPLRLTAGGDLNGNIVNLRDVGFAYPNSGDALLFQHADMAIDSSSRIVLLGENGNGKTTLVKLVTGHLEPTQGEVLRNPHARIAIVNQHHADQIDLSLTPLAFMRRRFPGDGSYEQDQRLRGHLAQCGVTSELQQTPALALSGGQRSRVAMAATSYEQPHLLILDEPTNNLGKLIPRLPPPVP